MRISIFCSDPAHPVMPWLSSLVTRKCKDHEIAIKKLSSELKGGDILFLVSCHEVIKRDLRDKFLKTLVIHASDLPSGRGWSPHTWQILEGKSTIAISLLNAEDTVDTGDIWKKVFVTFEGHELFDEINRVIFNAEIDLMDWAIENCMTAQPFPQSGDASYYRKRTPTDSRLDPKLSIESQFDIMRVADPERYPAFFELRNHKYKIVLEKI